MGCRNCGAPLPEEQAIGVCPHCGTLFGERAELEEYAAAVLSGQPLERPKSIATPRLKVDFQRGTRGDYRSAGSDRSLVITLRYFSARSLVGLLLGLLALAGIGLLWYLALRSRVYGFASVATVLLAVYAWFRLTVPFDKLLVRLSGEKLYCRQSRFWPRIETTLPCADIVQLFTLQTGRTFALLARLQDGKARPLVRNMGNAELGVYLERQLELALGVADQPEPRELPRNAALPKPARRRLRGFAIELGIVATLVIVPIFGIRACGTAMARIDVGAQPRETSFKLDKPARVTFLAKIELSHDRWRSRKRIPKVLTFDIDIQRNGVSLRRLGCDPFAVDVWTSSSHNYEVHGFWGPMKNCALKLSPGRYTITAVRRWKPGEKHIALETSVLEVRR